MSTVYMVNVKSERFAAPFGSQSADFTTMFSTKLQQGTT